jgi:hypothetical protein
VYGYYIFTAQPYSHFAAQGSHARPRQGRLPGVGTSCECMHAYLKAGDAPLLDNAAVNGVEAALFGSGPPLTVLVDQSLGAQVTDPSEAMAVAVGDYTLVQQGDGCPSYVPPPCNL